MVYVPRSLQNHWQDKWWYITILADERMDSQRTYTRGEAVAKLNIVLAQQQICDGEPDHGKHEACESLQMCATAFLCEYDRCGRDAEEVGHLFARLDNLRSRDGGVCASTGR